MDSECEGTWREYHGPLDCPVPEGAWLMQCDGCGEIQMFSPASLGSITLVPGRTPC